MDGLRQIAAMWCIFSSKITTYKQMKDKVIHLSAKSLRTPKLYEGEFLSTDGNVLMNI